MELKKLKEKLSDADIEFRIGNISENKGFSLLAYKTARADMARLDEVCGAKNWQNKHYVDSKGNVICSIGIYCKEKNEWIWKEDTGSESFTEKEKGSYSDSFKRAGFRWGIGIELYKYPFIWIKWDNWYKNNKGKMTPKARVRDWKKSGNDILDEKGNKVGFINFTNSQTKQKPKIDHAKEIEKITDGKKLKAYIKENYKDFPDGLLDKAKQKLFEINLDAYATAIAKDKITKENLQKREDLTENQIIIVMNKAMELIEKNNEQETKS